MGHIFETHSLCVRCRTFAPLLKNGDGAMVCATCAEKQQACKHDKTDEDQYTKNGSVFHMSICCACGYTRIEAIDIDPKTIFQIDPESLPETDQEVLHEADLDRDDEPVDVEVEEEKNLEAALRDLDE